MTTGIFLVAWMASMVWLVTTMEASPASRRAAWGEQYSNSGHFSPLQSVAGMETSDHSAPENSIGQVSRSLGVSVPSDSMAQLNRSRAVPMVVATPPMRTLSLRLRPFRISARAAMICSSEAASSSPANFRAEVRVFTPQT